MFLRLVTSVDLGVDYTVDTRAPLATRGSVQVFAVISGSGNWSRQLALQPAVDFTGSRVHSSVRLDLDPLLALQNAVSAETGLPADQLSVAIIPRVHLTGTIAGQSVDTDFAPAVDFTLLPSEFSLADAPSVAGPADPSLTPSQPGTVTRKLTLPAQVSILSYRLYVKTARRVAVGGGLTAILLAIGGLILYRMHRSDAEPVQIERNYHYRLIEIRHPPSGAGTIVVDVAGIRPLARLAQRNDSFILHYADQTHHGYFVDAGPTIYRYQPERSGDVPTRPAAHRRRGSNPPNRHRRRRPDTPAGAASGSALPSRPAALRTGFLEHADQLGPDPLARHLRLAEADPERLPMPPAQLGDDLEPVPVDAGHRRRHHVDPPGVVVAEHDQRLGMVGVHVADDPGRRRHQRVGGGRRVGGCVHPARPSVRTLRRSGCSSRPGGRSGSRRSPRRKPTGWRPDRPGGRPPAHRDR